ncbi:hypothetical protein PMAYCL1PPCAC_03092, partial [Pristionchus mayeri]
NSTSLPYNFHWDRDFALDYVNTFQKWFPIYTLFTVHPLVFYVLLAKSAAYGRDVKLGYMMNQVVRVAHEVNVSYFYRLVNLIPYAGLYCDGPICRAGLPHWALIVSGQVPIALTIVAVIIPFQFLLFRFHSMIVSNSTTKIRFSNRAQAIIISIECFLLLANVFSSAYFARDSDDSVAILQKPELEWLTHRGGTIFMFGPPGYPQYFMYEGLTIFFTILLIAPFITFMIMHASKELRKRVAQIQQSTKTQQMRNSVIAVFYAQMVGILIFYINPMGMFIAALAFDFSSFPGPVLAWIRYLNMPLFMLEALLLSLIFLVRNPNRRV